MCRYDTLQNEATGDIIIIMPTWRQWIAQNSKKMKKVEGVTTFENTNYYEKWLKFLNSDKLEEICRQNKKKVIFYPHRNMRKFAESFKMINKDFIEVATWPEYDMQELLKKGSLLITDYSSVAMDFAYLNKPIIYYQFDYERFRKWHLEEGYFNYEKYGFGKIEIELEGLIDSIKYNIENKFKLDIKYQNRINTFFDLRDKNNCERTYYAIKEI